MARGDASSSRCTATRPGCSRISPRSATRTMPDRCRSCSASPVPHDPAIAVVERLRAAFPDTLDRARGRRAGRGSQSEGRKPRQHERAHRARHRRARRQRHPGGAGLSQRGSSRALERQRGGAVTCPYYGISTGGLWSQLSRLNIDGHFLARRHGRRALQAVAAVSWLDHRAAPRARWRRSAASRRSPIASPTITRSAQALAQARRAGDGAAVCRRPRLRRDVLRRTVAARGALGADHPHDRSARLSRLVGRACASRSPLIALCLGGGWPALPLAVAAIACRARCWCGRSNADLACRRIRIG